MIRQLFLLSSLVLMLTQCDLKTKVDLKNGDLLFCGYNTGNLSDAIDEVTQTKQATHYSHIAIVQILSTDTFVLHASSKKGVVKEKLARFIKDESANTMDIYRLQPSFEPIIPKALNKAQTHIGQAYNFSYAPQDSGLYCSQFIYLAFQEWKVFALEPMTFKDPGTNKFHPGWLKYYQQLGKAIPEGELGCNPNGLAASANIYKVGALLNF